MRYYLIAILIIFTMISACSKEVAKDTAEETAKDVVKEVESGVTDLSQNLAEAAPYIKEDLAEGFWNALDMIGEAMGVGTSEPLPKPGDEERRKLLATVDTVYARSVIESSKRVREKNVSDLGEALNILGEVMNEEIMSASTSSPDTPMEQPGFAPGQVTDATGQVKKMPTPDEVQQAWTALAAKVEKPAAVRKLFSHIMGFVNTHPEYKSKAGIAGPVSADKIGQKARDFLATLKVGDVSRPFKFMKGYVIVQVIDDSPDKVEVGYIYMPDLVPEGATSSETGETGTAAPGTVTDSSGAAPGGN